MFCCAAAWLAASCGRPNLSPLTGCPCPTRSKHQALLFSVHSSLASPCLLLSLKPGSHAHLIPYFNLEQPPPVRAELASAQPHPSQTAPRPISDRRPQARKSTRCYYFGSKKGTPALFICPLPGLVFR